MPSVLLMRFQKFPLNEISRVYTQIHVHYRGHSFVTLSCDKMSGLDLLIKSSNTRCEFTSAVQIISLSNLDKMVGYILLEMDG